MSEPTPQRVWRANCLFCGAKVELRSSASPMAVCTYCKSTLVRDGESLRRIGQSAAFFSDHSPLLLGARGKHGGRPFTLVGRVQMAYTTPGEDTDGLWSEWHALFDDGDSAWLSEDNGGYVLSTAWAPADGQPMPDALSLRVSAGDPLVLGGQPWVVGSIVMARVQAAEGELAFKPDFKNAFKLLELRNTRDEVLSVDTSEQPPRLYLGRKVVLDALGLSGLADLGQPSEGQVKAQGIECPSCGASVEPRLSESRSITCGACKSVIDISQGLGKDLKHYTQENGLEPLIPLGRTGRLKVDGQVGDWQVVGYQERVEVPGDPQGESEQTFWREYLLYNRQRGFAFLVDAEDGWSVVRPVTGVPAGQGSKLQYRGTAFKQTFTYPAKTTYVLGEFYWPVRKDQRSLNIDYVGTGGNAKVRLNREKTGQEVTWSLGQTVDSAEVIQAFGLHELPEDRFKRDARVWSGSLWGEVNWVSAFYWAAIVIFIIWFMVKCSDNCSSVADQYGSNSLEYQQCRQYSSSGGGYGSGSSHGGSYGGYNSGGFHK
jgi:DNA-directed RNA polymerase subunit RPC12/RpoP